MKQIVSFFNQILEALFDPLLERRYRWLSWVWLAGLYLLGGLLWGKFLNWGSIPFDYHDWAEVWAPRITLVRDAVLKGVLPLHMDDIAAMRGVTDRFMSLPDMMLTPQMILLRFLDVGPFILVNILLLYTLGMLGLLWLRRRFSLSLVVFSVLFLLFNLNGHILSHISVGHVSWSGYFLLSFFVVLVVQLLDGRQDWWWVTKTAVLLFIIFIQGAFHPFIWCLMFLGLIGISAWKYLLPVSKAILASLLLSMVRILPPVLVLGSFDTDFYGGYPSLFDLWRAMVALVPPEAALDGRSLLSLLGWWELDLYIGLVGAVFLVYFGIFHWLREIKGKPFYPALLLPVVVMTMLSIGRVYRLVRLIPVPLFSAERVSSRMIILPLIFLLVLGSVYLQQWLNKTSRIAPLRLTWLALLLIMAHDLWQHLKLWQVTNAFPAFPETPRHLSLISVTNHPDPQYISVLGIGAAVSVLTMLLLLYGARRDILRSGGR